MHHVGLIEITPDNRIGEVVPVRSVEMLSVLAPLMINNVIVNYAR